MKSVLIFVSSYLPGYKAGGPIRSIANIVDHVGDECRFHIVTSDRDSGDTTAYPGVMVGHWQKVGRAEVYYESATRMSFLSLRRLICSTPHDTLYLNSFFAYHATIKPLILRRLNLIPRKTTIVAPRGEFSTGALRLKRVKKQFYLRIADILGLYRGITWQASSKHEEDDIRRCFGLQAAVIVAPNLPSPVDKVVVPPVGTRVKSAGSLKIIFLSRIVRKKNLDYALKSLQKIQGEIQFNIYGPLEDQKYWAECQKEIELLPGNIKVTYCGSVIHEEVEKIMSEHDLFFFPTLGENFGHVILEAFCASCPVLISDQTPWRGLESMGGGWEFPLEEAGKFQRVLQQCVDMDKEEHEKLSQCAGNYGALVSTDYDVVAQSRKLFSTVVD